MPQIFRNRGTVDINQLDLLKWSGAVPAMWIGASDRRARRWLRKPQRWSIERNRVTANGEAVQHGHRED